ncbi:MAG: hypothetical protein K2N01_07065 [Lachnospiraceae bacterium]|nr:hypothetical protein [Lachnospiraceae bacterium]
MLAIAVCDDEVIECCRMAKKISDILERVLQRAVRKTETHSQEFMIINRERQKRKLFLDDIYYFEIKGRVMDVHSCHKSYLAV